MLTKVAAVELGSLQHSCERAVSRRHQDTDGRQGESGDGRAQGQAAASSTRWACWAGWRRRWKWLRWRSFWPATIPRSPPAAAFINDGGWTSMSGLETVA